MRTVQASCSDQFFICRSVNKRHKLLRTLGPRVELGRVLLGEVPVQRRDVDREEEACHDEWDHQRPRTRAKQRKSREQNSVAKIVDVRRQGEQPLGIEVALVLGGALPALALKLRRRVQQRSQDKKHERDPVEPAPCCYASASQIN